MYIKLFENFNEKIELLGDAFDPLYEDFDLEFKIESSWFRSRNPENFQPYDIKMYSVKINLEGIPNLKTFSKKIQELCQISESYCNLRFRRLYVDASGSCTVRIDRIPEAISNSIIEVFDVETHTYEDTLVLDNLIIEFIDPSEKKEV